MANTPATPRLPAWVWASYGVCAGALILAFTPYRDATYPLAVVCFVGGFGAFVRSTSKGKLREPPQLLSMMTLPLPAMLYGVHVSSWGNGWLTLVTLTFWLAGMQRYYLFRWMGYARGVWLDATLLAGTLVLYVVGNLAPPDGWVGWAALAPIALFAGYAVHQNVIRPLAMRRVAAGAVGVGDTAPSFTLRSHREEDVSLSDFRGERPVLLFFVRGDWCPGCHILLRAYERNRAKFKERNVAVLAIGPDPVGVNREMADTLRLEYGLLFDERLEVARAYGLLLEGWESGGEYERGLPVPTAFLIDVDGVIRFSSGTDVGSILEPEAIFPVLEELAAVTPSALPPP